MARKRRGKRGGKINKEKVTKALKSANKLAQDTQIISKALKEAGFGRLGAVANKIGYGKRRKTGRRKTQRKGQRGGGVFDVIGKVMSAPGKIVGGTLLGASQGLGAGVGMLGKGQRGGAWDSRNLSRIPGHGVIMM